MITCATCKSEMRRTDLACRNCLERKFAEELWRRVRNNDFPIVMGEDGKHLRFINSKNTLCGKAVRTMGDRDHARVIYDLAEAWPRLKCRECAQQVKQNAPEIAEAGQAVIAQIARKERGAA